MRAFASVPIALAVCLATPAFADAQTHVAAAQKAEKKHDWKKALAEWKAAYAQDMNAEYLIGIGDAQAKLGNKAEAKKSYEAYLADPLALPKNAEKVKAKLAALDSSPGATLALPGAAAAGAAGAKAAAPPPLPLPGLDLPAPAATAQKKPEPAPLDLPGAAPKKEPAKVATASVPDLPLPGAKPDVKPAAPAVAGAAAGAAVAAKPPPPAAKPIAMTTPPPPSTVPSAAVTATPVPASHTQTSGVQKTMAYVTAGIAVVALGGGAIAFSQANSTQNDLNGKVHSSAEAEQLVQSVNKNKTLSFIGFAGGLAAAGISAALFAF